MQECYDCPIHHSLNAVLAKTDSPCDNAYLEIWIHMAVV